MISISSDSLQREIMLKWSKPPRMQSLHGNQQEKSDGAAGRTHLPEDDFVNHFRTRDSGWIIKNHSCPFFSLNVLLRRTEDRTVRLCVSEEIFHVHRFSRFHTRLTSCVRHSSLQAAMTPIYLLVLLLPLISAQTYRWGPCPSPQVQPSFNLQWVSSAAPPHR